MNIREMSTKDRGKFGEKIAAEYLYRHGFLILGQNIARRTGEIDILAEKYSTLHFIEVKSLLCKDFPIGQGGSRAGSADLYVPSDNLHAYKIRKVIRTAEWILAEEEWEGEWQIDAILVWIRERDGRAWVRFLTQIL